MVRFFLGLLLGSALQGLAQDADIWAGSPTTDLGCTCKNSCSTALDVYCQDKPFCTVTSKHCAKGDAHWLPFHGYYDYCNFEAYEPYEQQSAAAKQALLLDHVHGNTQSSSYPWTPSVLTGVIGESVTASFEWESDVFTEDRTKYIHSVGVTGGIRFQSANNHPYTGLFKGADYGVVRFSSANEPSSAGFTPGMGVKFLRDGRPSANFVAMYSLDGQPASDTDFFQHEWSNHIPLTDNFGLKIIAAKFWQASNCPTTVGISDLASEGSSTGVFPFKLDFRGTVSSDCPVSDYAQCLANLGAISEGTKLFDVYAHSSPTSGAEYIGEITLTSRLTTSKFGDEQLFFKHQRLEEDLAIHPEWLLDMDPETDCGMHGISTQAPTIQQGCTSPFGAMLNSDSNVPSVV